MIIGARQDHDNQIPAAWKGAYCRETLASGGAVEFVIKEEDCWERVVGAVGKNSLAFEIISRVTNIVKLPEVEGDSGSAYGRFYQDKVVVAVVQVKKDGTCVASSC